MRFCGGGGDVDGLLWPTEQKAALHEKYMDSYYARFPGRKVWAQGDFIYQDKATKGLEILGRSDGVLNPVSASLPPFFAVSFPFLLCVYSL